MDCNKPYSVGVDAELRRFEDYLRYEKPLCDEKSSNNMSFKSEMRKATETISGEICAEDCLKKHIGKRIRVESFIGGRTEVRTGKLLEVCKDFLTVKISGNCRTMMIKLADVRYITIMHNM